MNKLFTVSQLETQNEMRISSAYNQVTNMRTQATQINSKLDEIITLIHFAEGEREEVEKLKSEILTVNDVLSDEV
jgi:hypothetical protein